jgi:CubicO group peptidase (beta-lactamase class C family)
MERAESLRAPLEGFVARVQRETRVPGIGVALSIAGERLEVYGGAGAGGESAPLSSATRFHLGCTTKLLLAMLVLELADGGALALDAPIGEYVAELRGTQHGRHVRVAHLLSHTSGYRGTNLLDAETRIDTWEQFVAYLRVAPALFAPGTVFSYEHTESVLLAEIVQRVTGRSSLELVVEQLLAPLAIEPGEIGGAACEEDAGRHRFDPQVGAYRPLGRVPPIASFWLPAFSGYTVTLGELLKIAETAAGVVATVLADATLAALATSVVRLPAAAGGPLSELLPVGFGLGTAELRDGCRGNTGISAGQCLGLRFEVASGCVVAAALNAGAPHVRDFVLATVAAELLRRPSQREQAPFELDLAALAGTYWGPGGGIVRARCSDGRLVCEIGREHRDGALLAELSLDSERRLVLRSPVPQLSIGFFTESQSGAAGLMLGLSAYRRIAA